MDKEFGIHDTGASDQWPDSNSASPTARVKRLRQESLDAVPSLSTERAVLMTEFYRQEHGMVSTPVKRALAFRYLMENKAVCILEGELIVGEKGPGPKATPTFPELCCHSLEDLRILDTDQTLFTTGHCICLARSPPFSDNWFSSFPHCSPVVEEPKKVTPGRSAPLQAPSHSMLARRAHC